MSSADRGAAGARDENATAAATADAGGVADPDRAARGLLRLTVPSLAAVGFAGAVELLRSRFQHRRVFRPTRYPAGIWNPALYGLPYRDVWFASAGGVKLHGWWIEHRSPAATLVFCHGNTGSIGHRIALYLQLRRLGVNLLAFDYRGYGRSSGQPSEQGLFCDVRAALDLVGGEYGIPCERVILFGHSLGGAVAIDGARHRPVAGLIVQASFTQLRDMARHAYPDLPLHLVARNQFRSIDKVSALALPKLFLHGTDDPTIPLAIGETLFAAAAEPKEWYPVPGAGHNDLERWGGEPYLRILARFIRRCVPL